MLITMRRIARALLPLLVGAIVARTSHGFVQQPSSPLLGCLSGRSHLLPTAPLSPGGDGRRSISPITAITKPKVSTSTSVGLSAQEIIEAGVSFDTFAPQFLWLLIIGLPEADITKKIMGPIVPIVTLALVHLLIVAVAAAQEGALDQVLIFREVFDPSLSQLAGMQKLFEIPNFVAEEWPHVLIWDLFVGRQIWIDGLERGIDTRLSLAFCNFIGPPGLLVHVATCLITGKGLPPMGYKEDVVTKD